MLNRPVRVLYHLRTSYPPYAKTGADVMAERLLTFLAAQGCEVVCICATDKPYAFRGVEVRSNRHLIGEHYDWCDVVIAHMVSGSEAIQLANRFNKPIFHVVHNEDATRNPVGPNKNYLVFNTVDLQKKCRQAVPSIVVNPPTWKEHWQEVSGGEHNTLINCCQNKGAVWFHSVATDMAREKFLGVHGGYGPQFTQHSPNGNLKYMGFTHDMQSIYNQTRVLCVPSQKESWSMSAAEAQCCGIPVVCNELPGLRENLGDSAIYASGKRAWLDAINMLRYPAVYRDYQRRGFERQAYREKLHTQQLTNFFTFMLNSLGLGVDTFSHTKIESNEHRESAASDTGGPNTEDRKSTGGTSRQKRNKPTGKPAN